MTVSTKSTITSQSTITSKSTRKDLPTKSPLVEFGRQELSLVDNRRQKKVLATWALLFRPQPQNNREGRPPILFVFLTVGICVDKNWKPIGLLCKYLVRAAFWKFPYFAVLSILGIFYKGKSMGTMHKSWLYDNQMQYKVVKPFVLHIQLDIMNLQSDLMKLFIAGI